jgi:hypothetical protein
MNGPINVCGNIPAIADHASIVADPVWRLSHIIIAKLTRLLVRIEKNWPLQIIAKVLFQLLFIIIGNA